MINKIILGMSVMWLIGCSIVSVMLTINVYMNIVTYSDIILGIAYICAIIPLEILVSAAPLMMWLDVNDYL